LTPNTDSVPEQVFSWPGFFRVASRPRWLGALLLALLLASAFAFLGQWQLKRSVQNVNVSEPDTETPVPLVNVAVPAQAMSDSSIGQRVWLSGEVVAGDFVLLTGRENDGERGSWLIAHVLTEEGFSLAVGLGWAPDEDSAAAAEVLVPVGERMLFAGRYLPSESVELDDFRRGEQRSLSIAALVNLWQQPSRVYPGYLALEKATPGLVDIYQPPPFRDVSLNWLNLFYAAEWAIFAGFAVYLWYRVVRDVWEKESETITMGVSR